MGSDDGRCDVALDGVHQFEAVDLVVNGRGTIDQVHTCVACGTPAYEAAADPTARPPL